MLQLNDHQVVVQFLRPSLKNTENDPSLALLLPRLDQFAQTRWLVDGVVPAPMLGALALQTLIFVALITSAAMFDMYRKNL